MVLPHLSKFLSVMMLCWSDFQDTIHPRSSAWISAAEHGIPQWFWLITLTVYRAQLVQNISFSLAWDPPSSYRCVQAPVIETRRHKSWKFLHTSASVVLHNKLAWSPFKLCRHYPHAQFWACVPPTGNWIYQHKPISETLYVGNVTSELTQGPRWQS